MDEAKLLANLRRLHNKMFVVAYGSLKSLEDAREVVQEACVDIWRSAANLRDEAKFDAYALQILRHRIVDRIRSGRRKASEVETESELLSQVPDKDSPNPEELALRAERLRLINQAIQALPPALRDPLLLRLAGLEDSEIAEVLGLPEGTIRGNRSRALKEIRKFVEDAGG